MRRASVRSIVLPSLALLGLLLAACSGGGSDADGDAAGGGTPVPTREAGPLEAEVVAMLAEGEELRWILEQEEADSLSERMGYLQPALQSEALPEEGYRGLRVAVTERSSAAPASAWAWRGRVLFEIQQGETGGDFQTTLIDEGRFFERFLMETGQAKLDPADYARLEAAFEEAGEMDATSGAGAGGEEGEGDDEGDDE